MSANRHDYQKRKTMPKATAATTENNFVKTTPCKDEPALDVDVDVTVTLELAVAVGVLLAVLGFVVIEFVVVISVLVKVFVFRVMVVCS
jgi:hypothetical protein